MTEKGSTTPTLLRLLEEVAGGSESAFESLYEQTVRRVYRVALNVIKNPAMAAEIVQEVYLLVWTSAGKYDPALGSPQTWILTLAHRRAVDRVRSEQSSSERGARHAEEMKALKHDSIDETVHRSLMAETVRRCLSSLTDHQAEAIRLAYYGGLTYVEVAEALNLKVPTAKSRIQSGLVKLRRTLEVEGYDAYSR
ncbi:sigma-70 family RNA polymerase sigma factor [Arthrobacter sp. TMN-37]